MVKARATSRVADQDAVSCIVSGYDQIAPEVVADELVVDDGPFAWELSGNCAFASDFEYSS